MGYTHYWRQNRDIRARKAVRKAWPAFSEECRLLIKYWNDHVEPEDRVAYAFDKSETPPLITPREVRFNGVGENGHETFLFERNPEPGEWGKEDAWVFNFCKTGRKPYDQLVCATLILAKHYFGDNIVVTSDGDFTEAAEWGVAFRLLQDAKLPRRADRSGPAEIRFNPNAQLDVFARWGPI
jgi:hypothetical protein